MSWLISFLIKFFKEMEPIGDGSFANSENRARYEKTLRRIIALAAGFVGFLAIPMISLFDVPIISMLFGFLVGFIGSGMVGASINPISRLVLGFDLLRLAKSMFFTYAIGYIFGLIWFHDNLALMITALWMSVDGIVLGFIFGTLLVSITYSITGAFREENNSRFN